MCEDNVSLCTSLRLHWPHKRWHMEHAARACMLDHAVSGTSRHMKARAGQALGGAKREGEQAERLSRARAFITWAGFSARAHHQLTCLWHWPPKRWHVGCHCRCRSCMHACHAVCGMNRHMHSRASLCGARGGANTAPHVSASHRMGSAHGQVWGGSACRMGKPRAGQG